MSLNPRSLIFKNIFSTPCWMGLSTAYYMKRQTSPYFIRHLHVFGRAKTKCWQTLFEMELNRCGLLGGCNTQALLLYSRKVPHSCHARAAQSLCRCDIGTQQLFTCCLFINSATTSCRIWSPLIPWMWTTDYMKTLEKTRLGNVVLTQILVQFHGKAFDELL